MRLLIADPNVSERNRLLARLGTLCPQAELEQSDSLEGTLDAVNKRALDIVFLSDEIAKSTYKAVAEVCRADLDVMVTVVGADDPDRMRQALGEGALGYMRRRELEQELPDLLRTLRSGGVYIPPVQSLRPTSELLRTSAGPIPHNFFREGAYDQLTERQREVLAMIRDDWTNAQIADDLGITIGTVKIHITAIFKALGVSNRVQAKVAAEQIGLPLRPAPTTTESDPVKAALLRRRVGRPRGSGRMAAESEAREATATALNGDSESRAESVDVSPHAAEPVRKVGRPRSVAADTAGAGDKPKRGPGRPPKSPRT